ncbi:hypothetical protein [Desulfospira joergensenii]|uniref:hypothetical protein n=1 Tax=Desulfospira joergensenii TaxID=53329 RepID=UPI0003B623A4|nr:hypothetical protein [Desulfospira joergensenii]
MSLNNILGVKEKFEIQTYGKPGDFDVSRHIPFTGSPKKHPHEKDKVILIADPFSANTFFYEFKARDISFAEELPSIANMEGKSVPMARIWLKKQSVGVQCTPFVVDDVWSR